MKLRLKPMSHVCRQRLRAPIDEWRKTRLEASAELEAGARASRAAELRDPAARARQRAETRAGGGIEGRGGDLVGLVPAAGHARRLAGRLGAVSKEVLPVGAEGRPAAALLLENLARAGVERVYVVLRSGKRDVAERLGDGAGLGTRVRYLTLERSGSVAETLDRAYREVRGRRVAVGFPDVLFRPADAFARVRAHQEASGADAVLGLVPTDRPDKADLVEADGAGRVLRLTIKPGPGAALPVPPLTWIAAIWGPAVTELLHRRVAAHLSTGGAGRELYPGDVLQSAVEQGLRIEAVTFPEGRHLDIGTPEDLRRAAAWV